LREDLYRHWSKRQGRIVNVSEPILIALDSGTSMVKALAFDAMGKVVTAVSRPNLFSSGNGGAVEQDMERTWEDTCAVLGELTARLNLSSVVLRFCEIFSRRRKLFVNDVECLGPSSFFRRA
jgi:glycerol kinase